MKPSLIVGFEFVAKHTPLIVSATLPSLISVPPIVAVVNVMFVTAFVVRVGGTGAGAGFGVLSDLLQAIRQQEKKIVTKDKCFIVFILMRF